jgi:gamma-glutamylaminecyclotransferase
MPSTNSINEEPSPQMYKFFFYGTLKKNQPNHFHLLTRNAKFVSEAITVEKWPLIVASDFNIPYLCNKKGYGHVKHI